MPEVGGFFITAATEDDMGRSRLKVSLENWSRPVDKLNDWGVAASTRLSRI